MVPELRLEQRIEGPFLMKCPWYLLSRRTCTIIILCTPKIPCCMHRGQSTEDSPFTRAAVDQHTSAGSLFVN